MVGRPLVIATGVYLAASLGVAVWLLPTGRERPPDFAAPRDEVKYGYTGEIQAELAATRLLRALGFGADRMYLIPRVRCYGCLRTPYYAARALDSLHARDTVVGSVPPDSYTDFEWVAVERHFGGAPIEAPTRKGWAWSELDEIDPSAGATRAERDALRLAATLLAHWDNKPSNQRLMCLADRPPSGEASDETCPRPFALIHDLGATFGPSKVDLGHWKDAPIWSDRARCLVSMRQFPYHGGTFPDRQIAEAGRQIMARQLAALSDRQLVMLFTAARFAEFYGGRGDGADVNAWARVLRGTIHEIIDGAPCPSEPGRTRSAPTFPR